MTHTSFYKGERFERYVEEQLFPPDLYKLVSKTHSYRQNSRRYVEDSLKPDFKFRDLKSGNEFYVEAKFRSSQDLRDTITITSKTQFERFRNIHQDGDPVFFCIGVGGRPSDPEEIALFGLDEVDKLNPLRSQLYNHLLQFNPVYPGRLNLSSKPTALEEKESLKKAEIPIKNEQSPTLSRRSVIFILGIVISGLLFLLTRYPSESPARDNVKGALEEYYTAVQNNNIPEIERHLTPILDNWYTRRNVIRREVLNDIEVYNNTFIKREIEVNWETLQVETVPNGYTSTHEMRYSFQSKSSNRKHTYRLVVTTFWSKGLKIRGIVETKL